MKKLGILENLVKSSKNIVRKNSSLRELPRELSGV